MFDDYSWISDEPSVYDYMSDDSGSSYYAPEYVPEPDFQYSPSYGLNYDSPSIMDYAASLGDAGTDLGQFLPASFDVSGLQPYTYSDVAPGAELLTNASPVALDFGGDFASNSVSDPYLRAAMTEIGNTNYGVDPSVQIAAQSGEAIPMGDGMYDYNGQLVDGQTLAQLMNPMKGFITDPWSGKDMSQPQADPSMMGFMMDPWTGKPTDSSGLSGVTAFDPTYGPDITNLGFLDENTARLYGLDLSTASGQGGWGGASGAGRGFDRPGASGGSLAQMVRDAVTPSYAAAGRAAAERAVPSQKTPEYNAKGNTSTSQAVRNVGSTAAMLAALLGSGDKKSPASSQGTIGTNPWEVARMKNRGVYTPMADGGSVLAKLKELYEQYGPGANRTERPRGPDRADPRQLIIDDGMVQNASRAMTGRQRQLDELERQAIQGMAMGGAVFPSTVSPRLVKHASGGQADQVPIAASGGEYVMDADSVAALGDGNTDAGSAVLDKMRQNLRKHKRSAPPNKIPPKAKSPLEYMKGR